jgi:hypothetical protein
VISKVYRKISVSFGLIQNFDVSDLVMGKVIIVNIAVTQFIQLLKTYSTQPVAGVPIVAHATFFFLLKFQNCGLLFICLSKLGVPKPRIEPLQALGTLRALSTRLGCHTVYILYIYCFIVLFGLMFSPWELSSLYCLYIL